MLLKYPNISYVSQGAHIAVEKSLENQEKVIFRARMCTRLKKKKNYCRDEKTLASIYDLY